tara:strand:+ start:1319 stop:1741 length:423 start_codon:yes stop_codon:yes gene_type:complete
MQKDACFKNLEVKDVIVARKLHVNDLVVHDSRIACDIHMQGREIKRLYERQHDTNAYTDSDKSITCSVKESFLSTKENGMVQKLRFLSDINVNEMPINSLMMCIDDESEELVHICNIKGTIKQYKAQVRDIPITFDLHIA